MIGNQYLVAELAQDARPAHRRGRVSRA
jgi:hypothetical protein